MLGIAQTFARSGVAVMVILHDLNLAAQYADRIAIFKSGSLTAYGVPAEALTPPHILRNFGLWVMVVPHPTRPFSMVIPMIIPMMIPE
jgi:iron complex transport system ATP-binding protein